MPKTKSKQPSCLIPADPVPVTPPPASPDQHACKLLSRVEVLALVGVSYPTLWWWVKEGHFPAPRVLGFKGTKGRIGWIESEVQQWMASLPRRFPKGFKMTEVA
jgi:predicted DNA-binding transcriptional regulator AlpA